MSGGLGVEDKQTVNSRPRRGIERTTSSIAKDNEHAKVLENLKRRRDAARAAKDIQAIEESNSLDAGPKEAPQIEAQVAATRSSSSDVEVGRDSALSVTSKFKQANARQVIPRSEQNSKFDLDDDEDDFNPDDESTPFNITKFKSKILPDHAASTSPNPASSGSRKRKLGQSAVQVPCSPVPPLSPTSTDSLDLYRLTPSYVPKSEHRPVEEVRERLMSPQRSRQATPTSDIMALPQSSSSSLSSSPEVVYSSGRPKPTSPTKKLIQQSSLRGRSMHAAPKIAKPSSSSSAAPKEQQNRKKTRAPTKPQSLSTAELQNLLPRRRRHGRTGIFDIANSDDEVDLSNLNSDDDEIAHAPARNRRITAVRKQTVAPTPATKKKQTHSARTPAVCKSAATRGEPGMTPSLSGKIKTTYSRRTSSDKENTVEYEEEDDGSNEQSFVNQSNGIQDTSVALDSSESEQKRKGELRKAAKMFREVDEWNLEFEEITASSSSPWDAR
jgi:hypothetical protein